MRQFSAALINVFRTTFDSCWLRYNAGSVVRLNVEVCRKRAAYLKYFIYLSAVLSSTMILTPFLASPGMLGTIHDLVGIDSGAISGVVDANGVRAFKGIPYAAPPIRDLRWREPARVQRWQGIREAKEFAPPCSQNLIPTSPPNIPVAAFNENLRMALPVSEDCLYLNVWTAAKLENERRPVLIWIPGGGFVSGSPAFLQRMAGNSPPKAS